MKYILLLCLVLASSVSGANIDSNFLKALHQVETSGRTGAIVGDNGEALGPFQIHRSYWRDAREFDKTIPDDYRQVVKYTVARQVVTAYLNRYCKEAVKSNDFQTMARVHNGGPKGASKEATLVYWQKVKKELDKQKQTR